MTHCKRWSWWKLYQRGNRNQHDPAGECTWSQHGEQITCMRQCHYSLLSPSAQAVGSAPPTEVFGQNPRHVVVAVGGLSQHILTLLLSGST